MNNFATEIDDGRITHDCVLFSRDRNFMATLGIIVNNKVTRNIVEEYEKLLKVKGPPTNAKIESRKADCDNSCDRKSRFYDLLERLGALNN